MKKIFLGLLMVPGLALGMHSYTPNNNNNGHNNNDDIIIEDESPNLQVNPLFAGALAGVKQNITTNFMRWHDEWNHSHNNSLWSMVRRPIGITTCELSNSFRQTTNIKNIDKINKDKQVLVYTSQAFVYMLYSQKALLCFDETARNDELAMMNADRREHGQQQPLTFEKLVHPSLTTTINNLDNTIIPHLTQYTQELFERFPPFPPIARVENNDNNNINIIPAYDTIQDELPNNNNNNNNGLNQAPNNIILIPAHGPNGQNLIDRAYGLGVSAFNFARVLVFSNAQNQVPNNHNNPAVENVIEPIRPQTNQEKIDALINQISEINYTNPILQQQLEQQLEELLNQ